MWWLLSSWSWMLAMMLRIWKRWSWGIRLLPAETLRRMDSTWRRDDSREGYGQICGHRTWLPLQAWMVLKRDSPPGDTRGESYRADVFSRPAQAPLFLLAWVLPGPLCGYSAAPSREDQFCSELQHRTENSRWQRRYQLPSTSQWRNPIAHQGTKRKYRILQSE